jgi:uncharacterized phage-like protein YoqJ
LCKIIHVNNWDNNKLQFTVCFSGHRPEKLPLDKRGRPFNINLVKSILYYEILELFRYGYTRFISGCARGVDLWAAEIVMGLMSTCGIELICALPMPYKSHILNFSAEEEYLLAALIRNSRYCFCTGDKPSRFCFSERNKFMVDNSSAILAVISDYKSGTGQTVGYAKKKNLDMHIIDADKLAAFSDLAKNKKGVYYQ